MGRAGLFLLPLSCPMGPAVWHIDFVRATRGGRRCPAGGHGAAAGSERRKDANSLPSFSAQLLGKGMASGSLGPREVVGVSAMHTVSAMTQ